MHDQPAHHLFSYGTLQQTEVQLSQFGRLLHGRPDALRGYRITTVQITDPAVVEASGSDRHPMVVPAPGSADLVEGQVLAITDAELAVADAYGVDEYTRVKVTLRSGTRAWVYLDRASAGTDAVREWLRSIEVFAGPLPDFDPAVAPAEPVDLFLAWRRAALAAGVPDAHAMFRWSWPRGPGTSCTGLPRPRDGTSAGTRIGPALLGPAAACGNDTLPVRPRPRVRVLVTGDELTRAGRPATGRVRDALGPLLPPRIEASGGETVDVRHVPDRPVGSLRACVGAGAYEGVDVTVVTGSTSVGVTDQLRLLLAEADAHWVVDSVACRPGHPQLLARLPGHWVVGLPGNPYGALVAAHTLLAPLLSGLLGRPLPALPRIPLTGDIRPVPGRTRLVPVAWDGATARPVGGDRPAFLHGAAPADALAAVAPDWRPGQPAPLILHH